MKDYDGTVKTVFKRINEYEAAKKSKRQMILKIAVPVSSILVVAIICLGVWKSGMFDNSKISKDDEKYTTDVSGDSENSIIDSGENTDTEKNSYKQDENDKEDNNKENNNIDNNIEENLPIIWNEAVGDTEDNTDEGMGEWNGKKVSSSLLEALNKDENVRIAVTALILKPDREYVYNGKKLQEYEEKVQNERQLYNKLKELLKLGDELKYGEALYLTGTPSGEKWIKELYLEVIAYFGEEMLAKYIVDGEFLKEKVENDIEEYGKGQAQSEYNLAYEECMNQTLKNAQNKLKEQNISFDEKVYNDYIIIYVTKDEFRELSIGDVENWYFGFAVKVDDMYVYDEGDLS